MKLNPNLLYEEDTFKIREACREIWKEFGGNFKEKIIDRALTISLKRKGLKVDLQKRINIYYRGEKVGTYVPDKIINDCVLMEVKCKPFLMKEDKRQFWYYLKASPYKVGILVNFSPRKLEFIRRVYDLAREKEIRRKSA
ncbi:MAG: GxxExxY protein [Candidatus Nealsonbacteria bacterium CG_4_10_14_0_8_um_filter_35_10]|uniref:GxxExxY protein n=1 Tax=Candidatus Nealsonbacteria bacterium CG_4_10_14_0_8_um_filter_35_10 TaxID=1974683 RepID=A0A2M7R8Q9_9BACT|nr:MAG: GxxExxY protein [Candidatus Nealsonbacteria bacterium CG_4_10_14_0_8_um_filter_35_10]